MLAWRNHVCVTVVVWRATCISCSFRGKVSSKKRGANVSISSLSVLSLDHCYLQSPIAQLRPLSIQAFSKHDLGNSQLSVSHNSIQRSHRSKPRMAQSIPSYNSYPLKSCYSALPFPISSLQSSSQTQSENYLLLIRVITHREEFRERKLRRREMREERRMRRQREEFKIQNETG